MSSDIRLDDASPALGGGRGQPETGDAPALPWSRMVGREGTRDELIAGVWDEYVNFSRQIPNMSGFNVTARFRNEDEIVGMTTWLAEQKRLAAGERVVEFNFCVDGDRMRFAIYSRTEQGERQLKVNGELRRTMVDGVGGWEFGPVELGRAPEPDGFYFMLLEKGRKLLERPSVEQVSKAMTRIQTTVRKSGERRRESYPYGSELDARSRPRRVGVEEQVLEIGGGEQIDALNKWARQAHWLHEGAEIESVRVVDFQYGHMAANVIGVHPNMRIDLVVGVRGLPSGNTSLVVPLEVFSLEAKRWPYIEMSNPEDVNGEWLLFADREEIGEQIRLWVAGGSGRTYYDLLVMLGENLANRV